MRTALCLLALTCFAPRLLPQDQGPKHSPFGCSDGAVQIALDKNPSFRFRALDRPPEGVVGYLQGHEFALTDGGAPVFVRIYLAATLPEEPVGIASTAELSVYAEIATNAEDRRSGSNMQWWRLEGTSNEAKLTFQASNIAGCFAATEAQKCSFADVALATGRKDIPLLSLAFTENLGGANAANWTETRLLLDFRSAIPSVAVAANCSYNEGGGACTTYDSSAMERTNLQCDWKNDVHDFQCSQESMPGPGGHSDMYLLSSATPPLRADEVSSLGDALARFKSAGHGTAIKVRGISPVSRVDEVKVDENKSVTVLASSSAFYFAPEGESSIITVQSHPFWASQETGIANQFRLDPVGEYWTLDTPTAFSSHTVFRDRRLVVLQVVKKIAQWPVGVYWIGIDSSSRHLAFDVVQLAGHTTYAGCGQSDVQATAVSVGHFGHACEAAMRIQPSTLSSDSDQGPEWKSESENPEAPNCVRNGKIWWEKGKFRASMEPGPCVVTEKPRFIKIRDDGTVALTNTLEP